MSTARVPHFTHRRARRQRPAVARKRRLLGAAAPLARTRVRRTLLRQRPAAQPLVLGSQLARAPGTGAASDGDDECHGPALGRGTRNRARGRHHRQRIGHEHQPRMHRNLCLYPVHQLRAGVSGILASSPDRPVDWYSTLWCRERVAPGDPRPHRGDLPGDFLLLTRVRVAGDLDGLVLVGSLAWAERSA